jgi:hypothetical protein
VVTAAEQAPGISSSLRERVGRILVHVPGWVEAKIWGYIAEAYDEGLTRPSGYDPDPDHPGFRRDGYATRED